MGIVFFCQSCGARFEVAPSMGGRRGHCKKCGQIMTIPRADEIASMSAMPALALAGAGFAAGGGTAAPAVGSSIASWLKAGISGAALAPLTIDRMPIGPRRPTRPSPLDDAEDSKPYVLAQPVRDDRGRATRQDNAALNLWRRQLGGIQKVFRKVHQAAYLVSVPFLMILLFGIVTKSRQTALLGATGVVLLNIGRLVAGAANLAVVPLRDGVAPKRMRKPLIRVIEPAATIGLVVLAFTFIPWLSGGQSAGGGVAERIRSGAADLEQDIKGEVDRHVDVDRLGARAQEKFKGLGDRAREVDFSKLGAQAQEKLRALAPSSGGGATRTSPPGGGGR